MNKFILATAILLISFQSYQSITIGEIADKMKDSILDLRRNYKIEKLRLEDVLPDDKIKAGMMISLFKYRGIVEVTKGSDDILEVSFKRKVFEKVEQEQQNILSLSLTRVEDAEETLQERKSVLEQVSTDQKFGEAFGKYLGRGQLVHISQIFQTQNETGVNKGEKVTVINRERPEDLTWGLFLNYLISFVMQSNKNDFAVNLKQKEFISLTQLNYFFSENVEFLDENFSIKEAKNEYYRQAFQMKNDYGSLLLKDSITKILQYNIEFLFSISDVYIMNDGKETLSQPYVDSFDAGMTELTKFMRGETSQRLLNSIMNRSDNLIVV